jgi:hypothetical protein
LEPAVTTELWIVSGELRSAMNTHAREVESIFLAANHRSPFSCFLFFILYEKETCIHELEARHSRHAAQAARSAILLGHPCDMPGERVVARLCDGCGRGVD